MSKSISVKLANLYPTSETRKVAKSGKYVSWGADNRYPELLAELSTQSPTHSACLNKFKKSLYGDGIQALTPEADRWMKRVLSKKDLKIAIENLGLYNALAFKVILSRDLTQVAYLEPVNVKYLRPIPNEVGDIDHYAINTDWSKSNGYTVLPSFSMYYRKEEKYAEYIYFWKEYSSFDYFNPIPLYASAINDIATEAELGKFRLSAMRNAVVPGVIISMPEPSTEEEKSMIERDLRDGGKGSENAGRTIAFFNSNSEASKIDVKPFGTTFEDSQFLIFDETSRQRILSAWLLPSPMLVGVAGSPSMNGNSDEIAAAQMVWEEDLIESYREQLTSCITELFTLNQDEITAPYFEMRPKNFEKTTNE